MRRPVLLAAVLAASLAPAVARGAESRSEVWPELQVFVRLNDSTRLLLNPASTRSSEADDRIAAGFGVYLDYREPKAAASYRIGYVQSVTRPAKMPETRNLEHRLVLDYNYRWKWGAAGLVTDRTRLDLRDKEDHTSQRLRNRVQYEYATRLDKVPVVPFANIEVFYDTRFDTIARYKTELGVTVVLSPQADVAVYLGRQIETKPERKDINALGLILALHF